MGTYIAGKKVGSVFIGSKRVCSMYKGGKCIYSADGGEVPIECGLVFTGTEYINTGIVGSSNLRVMVDCIIESSPLGDTGMFGSRVAYGSNDFSFLSNSQSDNAILTSFSNYQTITHNKALLGQRITIDKNKNVITITPGNYSATSPVVSFSNTLPMFLGSVNNNVISITRSFNGTMYSCQIYGNDVLVRDFVPVQQGNTKYSSTPAPSNCMWDKVTQQYFENVGTGNFGIVDI
jgi:hypothetical protein